jgi:hypothetical protein
MADQLCTTAQVKTRIFPTGVTDTGDDALISELIDQVSGWIETYTGRKLVPEVAATYVFDTEPGQVLRVPRGIRTITSMGVAPTIHQPDTGGTYTTVPAADILLRPKAVDLPIGFPPTEVHISRGVLVGTISKFGRVDNGGTITGDFGWSATPPEITAITIDAVVIGYSHRKDGSSGAVGPDDVALPPWARFFSRGSPQRDTLNRYRYMALA